jgi:hypothetical protein
VKPKLLRNFVCAETVDQNAASLERLDGVRILVNGYTQSWRKSAWWLKEYEE